MSVINQMLKDLDQRKVEQQGSSNFTAPAEIATSNKKVLLISLMVIVMLNIIGLFVWQMYVENQALKKIQYPQIKITEQVAVQKIVNPIEKTALKKKKIDFTPPPNGVNDNNAQIQPPQKQNITGNKTVGIAHASINPLKGSSVKNSNNITKKTVVIEYKKDIVVPPSTLKISRKQLSPSELVQQKIKRAEQELANNNIAKAESLFEDILLILPEHKSARKQLAALWFGRQSYTPAINLLSQGIALSPTETEFRMMQARIYLQQNRPKKAFNVLNNLSQVNNVENVEYQSLRASVAQQLNEFTAAAGAYQTLADIEPSIGRWWLGLAVAHDSNSEFKQASLAYKEALTKMGLSDSAQSFVRQRMTELGEY
ncbi:MAG: tetratricopeptide repeat protein [Colwellia sp.]|nr:tetratricopeptide repeat protein [Colwellia sp.]